jgi:Purple acid Phosphatase, N-terminal domain
MASFNPFEIRNPLGQRGEFRPFHHQHHKHEGSPLLRSEELSDEEVTRLLFKTKPRRKIRYALLIKGAVLVVCLVALFGLGWICLDNEHSATPTLVELHRPHILPTLLSVVDPQTNLPVYALNNTLYERMLHSVDFVDGDARQIQRRNRRCEKECELPQLWLDKASIPATPKKNSDDYDYDDDDEYSPSITLSWSMGRDGKHGNVVLQDEDVIALYCGNNENYDPKSFLEAATIAQAKATSVRNGGSDHENTWFIPRFPILRQESCHFRLYLVMEATRKDEPSTEWQFLHVGSTGALTIENAKETPTAIHLAYSDTFSTMVVQFTTGNLTSDTVQAVPVVRHSQVNTQPITSNHDILSSHFEMTTGTSDTYFASDMCQEPANRTEAGKFYPPGMFHTVKVQNLKPSTTYQYQMGVSINGNVALWSEPSTFTTSSIDGDASNPEFSYIVYGDQGCPDSGCHVGKKWLSAMMERETKISSVHHFGDIR